MGHLVVNPKDLRFFKSFNHNIFEIFWAAFSRCGYRYGLDEAMLAVSCGLAVRFNTRSNLARRREIAIDFFSFCFLSKYNPLSCL